MEQGVCCDGLLLLVILCCFFELDIVVREGALIAFGFVTLCFLIVSCDAIIFWCLISICCWCMYRTHALSENRFGV
jgi:hypothetical protein